MMMPDPACLRAFAVLAGLALGFVGAMWGVGALAGWVVWAGG
jgi:hypothetical protein